VIPFEDPRRVLGRHGLRPRREWSQSFLVNAGAVARIASLAGAAPGDVVVEIGAGLGTLTRALAASGARVFAVEPERDTAKALRIETASDANVEVLEVDAMTLDLPALARGARLVVVGNLPYAIAAPLLVQVAEGAPAVARAVLMVQAEVARRVAGVPATKDYGALTIAVQSAMGVRIGLSLGPGSFHPAPKVRSAVLVLEAMDPPRVAPADRARLRPVVRAAFQRRRKTLRNALAGVVAPADAVDRALAAAEIDPGRRGETLSIEEFARLARAFA
jgi:16S rRNA (adenine1518-N6/adenine1519-N6)-dimethyltransferase